MGRKTNITLVIFLGLAGPAIAWPALSFADPLTPVAVDSLRSMIRRSMAAEHVPSLAVAVARHGRIVWEEGFGLADVERATPATARTRYSIASISKPLTATALHFILIDAGPVESHG